MSDFNTIYGDLRSAGESKRVDLIYQAIDQLRALDLERYEGEVHNQAINYLLKSNAMNYATMERLEAIRVWLVEELNQYEQRHEMTDNERYDIELVPKCIRDAANQEKTDVDWLDGCPGIEHDDGLILRSEIRDIFWLVLQAYEIDWNDIENISTQRLHDMWDLGGW